MTRSRSGKLVLVLSVVMRQTEYGEFEVEYDALGDKEFGPAEKLAVIALESVQRMLNEAPQ